MEHFGFKYPNNGMMNLAHAPGGWNPRYVTAIAISKLTLYTVPRFDKLFIHKIHLILLISGSWKCNCSYEWTMAWQSEYSNKLGYKETTGSKKRRYHILISFLLTAILKKMLICCNLVELFIYFHLSTTEENEIFLKYKFYY